MADKTTISELLQSAANLLKSQRYSEALPLLQSILTLDPNNEEALKSIGITFTELKKYNDAIIAYNRALALNQNNSSVWNLKGEALFNLAIYQEALDAFDKALLLNPNFEDAWTSKGAALSKLGRPEEALDACDKAISIGSTDGIAWLNKGTALSKLGRHQEALDAGNQALSINPNYAVAWNQKGVSLYSLGRYQEAFTAFDKAVEINPDYATAKTNRNNALEKIKLSTKSPSSNVVIWPSVGIVLILIAIIRIYLEQLAGTSHSISLLPSNIFSAIILVVFLGLVVNIIYWAITKVYPKSQNWGIVLWVLALVVITTIILSLVAIAVASVWLLIFGMSGSGSNINQLADDPLSLTTPQPIPTISESNLANLGSGSQVLQTTPTESLAQLVQESEATEAQKTAQAIDYSNPIVKNFANLHVKSVNGGEYDKIGVNQISDIWDAIRPPYWTYVSDPANFDSFTSASDTINNGLKGNCEDFAILNAALVESIGGTSRVITACSPDESSCHAYAEVFISDDYSSLQSTTDYLRDRYGISPVYYHSYVDQSGNTEYWLNLDWWANNPGGPFFQDDGTYKIFYPDGTYNAIKNSGSTVVASESTVVPLATPTTNSAVSQILLNGLVTPTPTPNNAVRQILLHGLRQ